MPELLKDSSNEADLLVKLCKLPFPESNREEIIDLIKRVSSWDQFVKLANGQGVIALVAANLIDSGLVSLLPSSTGNHLLSAWRVNIARNGVMTTRWKDVNEILCNASIKHLLIKGLALEYSVYGARGIRQMNDIDIYIPKEKALEAWHLLQNFGYVPEPVKSSLHNKILMHIGKHLPSLVKEGISVEIHHKLVSDTDHTKQALKISIDGSDAFIPDSTTHIEYLIDHMNYHLLKAEYQLRLSVDIAMLKKEDLSSSTLELVNTPRTKNTSKSRRKLYKSFFRQIPLRYKIRYLAGDIIPSMDWMKRRYRCGNAKLFILYPPRLAKLWWLV